MKKFIAVATSMIMAASLLTACGSDAASTETTTAAANEAISEKGTVGKEAEETEPEVEIDGAASAQFQSPILFYGPTLLYPILSSLVSSFIEKYVTWDTVGSPFPDSSISACVTPDGPGVDVNATIGSTTDFGMLARDTEGSRIEALGERYQDLVVARDALVVSVNAENPTCGIMNDTPIETIRQIFADEITIWDQVDFTSLTEVVNVYIHDLSGGAYKVFQKNVMGDGEVTASAAQSASMTELAINTAGNKQGIGYMRFGAYNKANANGQVLTAMKADGVETMAENIISSAYTTRRPVMFVTSVEITPSEQALIDYVFSQTGYDAVEANGYTPAFTSEA